MPMRIPSYTFLLGFNFIRVFSELSEIMLKWNHYIYCPKLMDGHV
jgi:hypothetical protein